MVDHCVRWLSWIFSCHHTEVSFRPPLASLRKWAMGPPVRREYRSQHRHAVYFSRYSSSHDASAELSEHDIPVFTGSTEVT